MPGQWAQNFLESSDHYTTKIGGLPDWPISEMFIKSDLLKCVLCGERLCLIAQANSPVVSSTRVKALLLTGCRASECESQMRGERGQVLRRSNRGDVMSDTRIHNPSHTSRETGDTFIGYGDSGGNRGRRAAEQALEMLELMANLVKDSSFKREELGRSEKQAATASKKEKTASDQRSTPRTVVRRRLEEQKELACLHFIFVVVVPCFYIYPHEDRSIGDTIGDTIAVSANYDSLLTKQDDNSSKDNQNQEFWGGEEYEYDKAVGVDRTFLKFKKRMDACPEQCFRYSYGGNPLLVKSELKEPSPCNLCGSPRQFEMQLMPPLLYFLLEGSDGLSVHLPEEWNWMTILVYTCSSNYGPKRTTTRILFVEANMLIRELLLFAKSGTHSVR
ncbi:hypothetical protein KSP40_PGU011240 [Platanthera guangdongensis]|uniref:Programmed cell death protein 2 C-terminal domain-containing protein n=1 Tax=Platanthera guangdongensis TaxID=2320717 RepID=A0ABR2LQE1_9ASPA